MLELMVLTNLWDIFLPVLFPLNLAGFTDFWYTDTNTNHTQIGIIGNKGKIPSKCDIFLTVGDF